MGNRMIKETIRTSKSVNALSDFNFRMWTYLITYVDDYGRGSADPELLKGLVFPRRQSLKVSQIRSALKDLAAAGMITLYESEGEPFFYFPKWTKHQRVQTKKSKFPEPPQVSFDDGDSQNVTVIHGELADCESTVDYGESPPETKPNQTNKETKIETETEEETKPNARARVREDAFADFCGEDKELLQALRDFEDMRKKLKKPMTEKAKLLILSTLKNYPREEWLAIINQSIVNSWLSVYPLKEGGGQNEHSRNHGKGGGKSWDLHADVE